MLRRAISHAVTQAISHRDVVIYDFTHAGYVDPSGALAIDEMIDLSQRHNRHVIVSGLHSHALRALSGMGVLDRIPNAQRFDVRLDAIKAAVAFCERRPHSFRVTRSAGPQSGRFQVCSRHHCGLQHPCARLCELIFKSPKTVRLCEARVQTDLWQKSVRKAEIDCGKCLSP